MHTRARRVPTPVAAREPTPVPAARAAAATATKPVPHAAEPWTAECREVPRHLLTAAEALRRGLMRVCPQRALLPLTAIRVLLPLTLLPTLREAEALRAAILRAEADRPVLRAVATEEAEALRAVGGKENIQSND